MCIQPHKVPQSMHSCQTRLGSGITGQRRHKLFCVWRTEQVGELSPDMPDFPNCMTLILAIVQSIIDNTRPSCRDLGRVLATERHRLCVPGAQIAAGRRAILRSAIRVGRVVVAGGAASRGPLAWQRLWPRGIKMANPEFWARLAQLSPIDFSGHRAMFLAI